MCIPIASLGDDGGDIPTNPYQLNEYYKKRKAEQEAEEERSLLIEKTKEKADLNPPPAGPFAVFGPRIGVERIEDVRPGARGRRVSVSDLKIGLP